MAEENEVVVATTEVVSGTEVDATFVYIVVVEDEVDFTIEVD